MSCKMSQFFLLIFTLTDVRKNRDIFVHFAIFIFNGSNTLQCCKVFAVFASVIKFSIPSAFGIDGIP